MRIEAINTIPLLALISVFSCKQHYTLPAAAVANVSNYLVVEGNINVGSDSTLIQLSHVVPTSDTTKTIRAETGATVMVETRSGGSFHLKEVANGIYGISSIGAGPATEKYRLNIKTESNNQYVSDFVEFKKTPVIDSISWEQHDDGVHIYVNTHDDANKTKYYKWGFTETWEYHCNLDSKFEYINGAIIPRRPPSIYTCWQTKISTAITLQSTTNLSNDVVYKKELVFIPTSGHRLGVLYTIIVSQSALTKEGYEFWTGLSKNTEQVGSIFDPLPTQLAGNIHSVTGSSEPVVGFVSATSTEKQRIWIKHVQVRDWAYPPGPYQGCDTLDINRPYALQLVAGGSYNIIVTCIAPIDCSDCRLEGGITDKPSFWP